MKNTMTILMSVFVFICISCSLIPDDSATTLTVATPDFSQAEGVYAESQLVEIICATEGATIYYTTDVSDPALSATRQLYSDAININTTMALRAIAVKTGWENSAEASAFYTITGTLSQPMFSPSAGTYTSAQTVSIFADSGATVYYTTNGDVPTTNSIEYSNEINVDGSITIRAIATKEGWENSADANASYLLELATPTFYPPDGNYIGAQIVSIFADSGATVYYTTNGDVPTTNSIEYSGEINVDSFLTVKAIASKTGWEASAVTSASYTIIYSSVNDFQWVEVGGNLTITNYVGNGGVVGIPPEINGKPVTSIGDNVFSGSTLLTSVSIPDSVTNIGNNAFQNCNNLVSVSIPDSITTIGDEVFYNCGSLESTIIPDLITGIGNGMFYNCSSLTNISIPDSVVSIGDNAFYGCALLASVSIPDSVTNIGNKAFRNCNNLMDIIIPDLITIIGDEVFYNCGSLESINIPNSVTIIGSMAFFNCDSLTSFSIPDSVISIGGNALRNCNNLMNVNIGASVTSIGNGSFYNCGLLTNIFVDAANTVYKSIDGVLFTEDETTIILYPIGKTIDFYSIPSSVTTIGDNSFSGCYTLTSVGIGNLVSYIGNGAFEYCVSFTNVVIPNSVTVIGGTAFYNCTNLVSVIVNPTVPPAIGTSVFNNNKAERKFYVPSGTVTNYQVAAGWSVYSADIESQ